MRAKPSLDKVCWQWADTTYPENVTPENVRRLKLHVCEMGSFERQFWKPDIALKNSNLEHKELGVSSLYVVNSYVGTVTWEPFQVFESTCSMDITNFPFDTQTCYLQFKSWVYPLREVEMICGFTLLATQYYKPNAGWDLTDVSCEMQGDWGSTISFSLTIRRKPLFFIMSVIFPMMMLAILNICVFVLPNDSGEKASYSISVFLAFAVFLTIFSASLPQNSNSVALIGVFLIIQTTCSTITTVFALALLRMSSFDENVAIPRIMIFFMRCLKCKSRSNASMVVPADNGATDGRMLDESSTGDVGYKSCAKSSRYVPTEIKATESRMSNTASTGDVEYSWREVVNFLDVVLFVTFACILIASSLWCYLSAINYNRSDY
ncbi:neuronal acetylcholine receptor subunit alpha-5-like [Dreissena polymorpha]|uniref:neuronal acetylcholine receptor subunit alpha-5-like n=1 Tax=Dreissena polymorpha TaxID=45954 RepID=UPI00226431DA|nr:neuronal acetylcholine receptor subunit alpha-5-like [Dreissena polymorpha]